MKTEKAKKLIAMALVIVLTLTGVFTLNMTAKADSCGGLEEADVYAPSEEEVIKDPVLHWAIRAALNSIKNAPLLTAEVVGNKQVQDISYELCAHPEDFKDWRQPYWIEDLEGLQYATSARMIDICYTNATEGKKIKSLAPISGLTQLRMLYLKQDGIIDIKDLKQLVNLEELNLYGNSIADVSAIADMIKLKKLTLEHNNISDISAIEGLKNLEYINIAYNQVSELPDLSSLKNVYYLDVNNNQLTDKDVEKISAMKGLRELNLKGNTQITDLKPLACLIYLEKEKTILPCTDQDKENLFAAIEVNKLFNKFNISKMKASDSENVGKAIEAYDLLTDEQKKYIDAGRVEAARANKELVDQGLEPVYYEEYDEDGEAQPVLDRLEITVVDKHGAPISGAVFVKTAIGTKDYISDESGLLSIPHSATDANWDLSIAPKDDSYVAIPEKIVYEVKDGKTYTINGKLATGFEKLQFVLIPKDEYVDKSQLEKAIENVKDVEEEYKYTVSSYEVYIKALEEAQRVFDDEDATDETVHAVTEALENAVSNLEKTDILTELKLNVRDVNGNIFTRPFKFQIYVQDTKAEAWNQLSDPYTGTIYLKASPLWEDGKKWEIVSCYEEPYEIDPIQVTIGVKDGQRYYKTVNGQNVGVDFEMTVTARVLPDGAQSNERKPDSSVLCEYIETAKQYKESDYTEVSYTALLEAIDKAEAVVAKTNATQEEYNAEAASILSAEKNLEKQADKLALKKEIDLQDAYTQELYTTASWTVYKEKLVVAEAVYEDKNATQDEVDKAVKEVREARSKLIVKANKSELGKKLEEAKAIKSEDYVNGYETLRQAIERAQIVYDDAEATKDQVDEAVALLQAAIDALEKKPAEPNYSCDPGIFRALITDETGKAVPGVTFVAQCDGMTDTEKIVSDTNGVITYFINGDFRGKKTVVKLSDSRYTTEDEHWFIAEGPSQWIISMTIIDGEEYKDGTKLSYVLKASASENPDPIPEPDPGSDPTPVITEKIKVSKIAISGISKKTAAGKKITLKATVSPSNADDKGITWKSDNEKVATVNSKGVVTIKKNTGGKTVKIYAIAKDGSGTKAAYTIRSMKGVVKKITVTGAKTVKAGNSLKLKAKVTASKGACKKVVWTSSNTKYAKVSASGKVKTYKAGKGKTVKITAKATDGSGKKKTVKIKIK
ncbi:MAG: leucine-rich repeat domain-containing protein [Lachnospiraceae bacterium]